MRNFKKNIAFIILFSLGLLFYGYNLIFAQGKDEPKNAILSQETKGGLRNNYISSNQAGETVKISTDKTIYDRDRKEYEINLNDILEISVYDEPDLSRQVRVGIDGKIFFPLLGDILVKGDTPEKLETKLTDLLNADYLVNAQVSVFVSKHGRIYLLGQVKSPGEQELSAGMTLSDAIIRSGGFTDAADVKEVKIVRTNENGEKITLIFDASKLLEGDASSKNIKLQAEDLVVVGSTAAGDGNTVVLFGQVARPGKYPFNKGMTVIDAVSLAGGLTPIAAADGVKIIRTNEGQRKTINIRLGLILRGRGNTQDIELEPYDVIVVPESFF